MSILSLYEGKQLIEFYSNYVLFLAESHLTRDDKILLQMK